MLKTTWFLFLAFAISTPLIWMLNHDGQVVITWLGFEAQTDILTAIILAILFTLLVFIISYAVTRILAIRFPNLLKMFFKKTYLKRLEKLVHRHWQGLDVMAQLLMAIETKDLKSSEKLQKKLSKLIKNPQLNNFLSGKLAFDNKDFASAEEFFTKLGDDKNAKILVLKSKFKLALETNDEVTAIAYAKQILSVKKDNIDMARTLLSLYKKQGLWQDAKELIGTYGIEQFRDELQRRDLAVMNTALAFEFYHKKHFASAIKHAKMALKSENDFLPAIEVMLKSWIKRGFSFKASWMIKNLWRENPHLILAEIFDLIHRKSPAKIRIKAMKKLAALNQETHLGKLAIGLVAFRASQYEDAKEFLRLSLLTEKTYRAYKLLAYSERFLGDKEKAQQYSQKAEMMSRNDHYSCSNCNHSSASWDAKCITCGSHDCLEWNS